MDGFDNNQNQSYNQVYGTPAPGSEPDKANGLQIAGLVLGTLAIILGCCGWYGLIFGVAGIICAVLGNKENSNGIGKAGLICSIIGCVLAVIMTILGLVGLGLIASNPELREMMEQYGYSF